MYAYQLNESHLGQDVTITVPVRGEQVRTGGILRALTETGGLVTVNLDGQLFTFDEEKYVEVRPATLRQELTMPEELLREDHPLHRPLGRSRELRSA